MIVAQAHAHFRDAANKARSEKMKGNKNQSNHSRVENDTTVLEPAATPKPEAESKRAWGLVSNAAGASQHEARQALSVAADAPDLATHVVAKTMKLSEAAKEAKARKANKADTKPKPARKPKPLPLGQAKTRIANAIADALEKLADEDMAPLRAWIANGCKP